MPMGDREFRPTADKWPHDIKALVRAYMLENIVIGAVENDFGDSDSFIQHHLCDSTGFLELIGFLEDRFGIKVEDHEMVPENLDSLNGIAAYVIKKRGS
jgi:acyl carrier protein